jgi:ABC-type multidrug transport system fused ATPase/permease subunit
MQQKSDFILSPNVKKMFINLRNLIKLFPKKLLPNFYFIQFIIIIGIFLESISIFSILPFLDTFNDESGKNLAKFLNIEDFDRSSLFLIFIFFLIISNLFQIIVNIKITRFGYDVTKFIKHYLYGLILLKKHKYFLKKETSYFNSLFLNETWRLNNGMIDPCLRLLSQLLLILFVLVGLLFYNFVPTLIIILLVSVFYVLYFVIISKKIYNNSKKISLFKLKLIQQINDNFSTIKESIFKKSKSTNVNNFFHNVTNMFDVLAFNQIAASIIKNLFEIFICIVLVCFFLLYKNIDYANFVSSYGVMFFAAYKLVPSFHKVYASFISFIDNSNALSVVSEELNGLNSEAYNFEGIDKNIVKKVNMENTFFSYEKNNDVLMDVNFEISKGSKIGICGESGSGKTTFADILSGLTKSDRGLIKVNDKKLDREEVLIRSFSYCGQKNFLIEDTIKNNITFKDGITIDEELFVKKLLKIVELDKFIENLRDNVDTLISAENGIKLSSGQAQRLCIARCLFSNKNFMIFDESFNNLDLVNRGNVLNNILENFNRNSLIMISHDVSLFEKFDKIIVFKSGKILSTGNFNDLKLNNEYFKQLLYKNEK